MKKEHPPVPPPREEATKKHGKTPLKSGLGQIGGWGWAI